MQLDLSAVPCSGNILRCFGIHLSNICNTASNHMHAHITALGMKAESCEVGPNCRRRSLLHQPDLAADHVVLLMHSDGPRQVQVMWLFSAPTEIQGDTERWGRDSLLAALVLALLQTSRTLQCFHCRDQRIRPKDRINRKPFQSLVEHMQNSSAASRR